jgi:hypothetical protein
VDVRFAPSQRHCPALRVGRIDVFAKGTVLGPICALGFERASGHSSNIAPMGLPRSPVAVALGFEMGLYSRADVSDWVDCAVARVEVVDGPLLELVTLRGKHDTEIVRLLSVLAGKKTNAELARIRLGILYQIFTSGTIDRGWRNGTNLPNRPRWRHR